MEIMVQALAGLASSHFWQIWIWQNFWPGFWIWLDLTDYSTAVMLTDYIQLEVMKVLAC